MIEISRYFALMSHFGVEITYYTLSCKTNVYCHVCWYL